MRRFGLRDDQSERIRGLLPGREGSVGLAASDNRLFVEAVLYCYRTGMPWRDLPERFGDGIKVHRRFSRWAKSGVWERMFRQLTAERGRQRICDDRHARGGLSTKIHALVDALGNPAGFFLTGGVQLVASVGWLN